MYEALLVVQQLFSNFFQMYKRRDRFQPVLDDIESTTSSFLSQYGGSVSSSNGAVGNSLQSDLDGETNPEYVTTSEKIDDYPETTEEMTTNEIEPEQMLTVQPGCDNPSFDHVGEILIVPIPLLGEELPVPKPEIDINHSSPVDENNNEAVDACMQTSGDWEYLLKTLGNTQIKSDIGISSNKMWQEVRKSEVFEMKELSFSLSVDKAGYNNLAYETALNSPVVPDTGLTPEASGKEQMQQKVSIKDIPTKNVKFHGTGANNRRADVLGASRDEDCKDGAVNTVVAKGNLKPVVSKSKRRYYHKQLNLGYYISSWFREQTAASKWQRIREIHLEEEASFKCIRCMKKTF